MTNLAQKIRNFSAQWGRDEKLVLINVAFIFLPYFVGAVTLCLTALYFLTDRNKIRQVAGVSGSRVILAFVLLTLATGLIYRNFNGVVDFLILCLFIVFSMYAYTIMTDKLSEKLIQLSSFLSILSFVIAVIQVMLDPKQRSASVFYNPNYYGYMCEILILLSLFGLLKYKNCRVLYLITVAANFAGIILSGCRSAWLAVFGGILIEFIAFKQYRKAAVTTAAAGVCFIIVVLFPKIVPRINSFGSAASLRELIWLTAWRGFLRHPIFGEGFLSYIFISAGRANRAHAHNVLLDMLVNFGIVGTTLLFILLITFIIKGLKHFRINPFYILALSVLTATAIHGITDVPIIGYQSGFFCMLMISLTGTCKNLEGTISA